MRASPLTDLQPLGRGLMTLLRHPLQTLGLAILMVILSLLGPILQIWAPVPDDPSVSMALAVVALVPMELYFLPRFLLFLDAEAVDHPLNPRASWKATFETRWMRAFVAKALLYLTVGAGMTCLVFPGLFLLAIFGWAPFRVLLRGESLTDAAKGSAALMARLWPRALMPVLVIVGAYLLTLYGALQVQQRFVPDPVSSWIRLTNPILWAIDFGGGLLNLWISATLLALYQRLEGIEPAPEPPAQDEP